MKVLGLTGGIGMGKSTAARCFLQRGVRVVDTDDLARELVEPGQQALEEIRLSFGAGVLDGEGRLIRAALARLVFQDDAARGRLEGILHPRIRSRWLELLGVWRGEGASHACVVIPLLFETGAEKDLDEVVCVACTERTQAVRLAARGWSVEQVRGRVGAQLPLVDKIARSRHVLWNEGPLEVLGAQVDRVLGRIQ
ncbi:MAG: dephospho-CoA kinase [Verrucomicrobia bacterium]|nr:dephospho-CoA kinase [Verrucomicrobiota bacterium]